MSANEVKGLKPFDLEKALKGEKVVTMDGREVTDITYFNSILSVYKVAGILEGGFEQFSIEGRYNVDTPNLDSDLFMAPKERVVWANLYGEAVFRGNAAWHDSQESADKGAGTNSNRLGGKAFPITITEGE